MKRLITILLILISLSAYSTDYYVRTGGSDANTGTVNTNGGAWKTVVYAAAHTVSGDRILVQAGTFTETAQVVLAAGVSLEGVDSTTSIIKSTATADFVPIISLASVSEGTNGNQHISNLKFDGQSTATSVAIGIYARSNVAINNCSFINFKFAAAIIVGKTSMFPNTDPPTTYATGNTFSNNTTINCSGYDAWGGSPSNSYGSGHLWVTGQTGILIHDNVMDETSRATRLNGWFLKATDYNKGLKWYNNVCTKAPYPYATQGNYNGTDYYWDFALECGDVEGVEIYNNTIQGDLDFNRQTKGSYTYSISIHDNTIGYPTLGTGYETGMTLEYGTDSAYISRNTFKNITEPITFSTRNLSAVNGITIQNNLAYNIGRTGGTNDGNAIHFISDGSNNYTVRNFVVTHNTFVGNASLLPNYGFSISNAGSATAITFDNNIFNNFAQNAIGANTAVPLSNVTIRNNNFFGCGTGIGWNTGTPTAPYITTGNQSTSTNPLFVGSGSYLLQSGSPCKNAGTDGLDMGYTGSATVPPTANAGADKSITLPLNSTTLNGTVTAGTNAIASIAWRQLTGGSSTIVSAANPVTDITGLITSGVRTYELTAISVDGSSSRDTVSVTVNPAPLVPPASNAGSDQTITLPTSQVTMAGVPTAGTNPVSTTIWSQYLGNTVTITNSANPNTTVTGFSIAGTYGFIFTVTDDHGNAAKDTMIVTVNSSGAAPVVSFTSPVNGATDVAITVHPTGTFSTALASGTVNTTNVTMTQAGSPISISVSLNSNIITITPTSSLTNNLVYVVTFGSGITNGSGTPLSGPYAFSFTTIASTICLSCILTDNFKTGGH